MLSRAQERLPIQDEFKERVKLQKPLFRPQST